MSDNPAAEVTHVEIYRAIGKIEGKIETLISQSDRIAHLERTVFIGVGIAICLSVGMPMLTSWRSQNNALLPSNAEVQQLVRQALEQQRLR